MTPDPQTLRIAEYWRQKSVARGNTPVAKVTADLTRALGDAAESTLYNATADAFQWAANKDGRADLAVAMPGILRNDIRYAANAGNPADAPGRVLFSEVALGTVYDSGIGVGLVRGDISGAQLDALLESQWQQAADGSVPPGMPAPCCQQLGGDGLLVGIVKGGIVLVAHSLGRIDVVGKSVAGLSEPGHLIVQSLQP